MADRAKADKPDFGVPMCGTLTWAGSFPDTEHPPKIDLLITGIWENARQRKKGGGGAMMNPGTEGDVWLPWKAAEALAAAGMMIQDPSDPKKFTPLKDQRFYIKREMASGSQAHNWTAQAIDSKGDPVTVESRPIRMPVHPGEHDQDAPQAVQAEAGAANGSTGVGPAPGAEPEPAQDPPAAQGQPPAQGQKSAAERNLNVMREADAMYRTCAAMSLGALMWLYRVPRTEIYPRTAQAGCATIMIRLEREGFKATHAAANTMRRLVDELDAEILDEIRIKEEKDGKADPPNPGPRLDGKEETPKVAAGTKVPSDDWPNRPEGLGDEEDDDLPF